MHVFPVSPCQSPWRSREVQPMSIAESKIHRVPLQVLRVLPPASSVPTLGPRVPVPPPAQPRWWAAGGCLPSRASWKRFCWRGRCFEAVREKPLARPQLALPALSRGFTAEIAAPTDACSRLRSPGCGAGAGDSPRGIKALPAGLKVGLSTQVLVFLFSRSPSFGFSRCSAGWAVLVAVGTRVSRDRCPVLRCHDSPRRPSPRGWGSRPLAAWCECFARVKAQNVRCQRGWLVQYLWCRSF